MNLGVVVHEMACAGVPILCSEVVGASKDLVPTTLQWNLEPNDTDSLFEAMKKAIETPSERIRDRKKWPLKSSAVRFQQINNSIFVICFTRLISL